MPRIFISYRREDSIAYAGRICDRLISQFGAANVFMDIVALEPGVDFVEVLRRTIASCDVFLAVIGVQWLTAKDEEGRVRLSNPEDVAGLEIATALERQYIRVVPILVGGARMPRSTELPERLADLTRRHALVLPDIDFHQALGRLIQSIERSEQQGKGAGSRSRLLAYVMGGLAAVLAAVGLFIARDNLQKPVPKIEPQVTMQPAPATSFASAPKTEPSAPRQRVRINPKDGLPYVWIPPGKFTMGCSPGDSECSDFEKPPHAEQIFEGFWLGQTEVTQTAWKKVMKGDSPSHFKSDQLPVDSVDWKKASAYCQAIGGRLPTEAEWEYAARAGSTAARYGPLDAIAWYSGNSGHPPTHPVALKQANAYGLYDMLGNVWEWTVDDYDGEHKMARGGSWDDDTKSVRASVRNGLPPSFRDSTIGFRCVGDFR